MFRSRSRSNESRHAGGDQASAIHARRRSRTHWATPRVLPGATCASVLAVALGTVTVASAARATAHAAAAQANVYFSIEQPKNTFVRVSFRSGISNFSVQIGNGTAMTSFAAFPNGFEMGALRTSNLGTAIVAGQVTPGTPITGTATVPAGATLTATFNDASQPITNGSFSIPTGSSPGQTVTTLGNLSGELHVSPGRVRAGERVKISGAADGGCLPGDVVTLRSRAFADTHRVAGVPAIDAKVRDDGAFAADTVISAHREPGDYRVTGRCDGGSLGQTAHLRVVG
jgi:hypothetical protein